MTAPPLYSVWMFNPSQNTILPVIAPVEGVMITEAIAAQPRNPLPAVIVDRKPPDLNPDLVTEGVGMLSIRSVYDIMGVDQARVASGALSSIASVSNPSNAAYAQRLVRFLRIEKPVSQPDDDDIADPDNSAFGPTGQMREIVAYAPVEPDGSVRMKVPGNIAFQLTPARRERPAHRLASLVAVGAARRSARVQRLPRAQRPRRRTSHGRKGSFNAFYAGATATGAAFPGTVNTISPEAGDTMAPARSRGGSSCIDPTTMIEHCGALSITPSADVVYNEIWKPAALPAESFSFSHNQLVTARPTNPFCYPDVDVDLPHHHSLRHHRHPRRTRSSAVVRAAPGRRRR